MTKERPILFSAPMVRAILDGTKTQTRRAINVKNGGVHPNLNDRPGMHQILRECKYGQPGDRLWVREAWRIGAWDENRAAFAIDYFDGPRKEWIDVPDPMADDGELFERLWIQSTNDARKSLGPQDRYKWEPGQSPCRWRPSIHMPRWASRIDLLIKSVRVEQLQDISEADAIAEGCTKNHNGYYWGGPHAVSGLKQMGTAHSAYRDLWQYINGPGSWEANPWVRAIEFERVEK